MKNNKGFVLILILALLPVGLTIIMLLGVLGATRVEYSYRLHICRNTLLEVQKENAEALKKLIALNPEAKQLRKEREIAEKAVKYGQPIPEVELAAQTYRALVIARQIALRAKQQGIISAARSQAATKLQELRRNLESHRGVLASAVTKIALPRPKFSVLPKPAFDLTPDYNPAPLFEVTQTMTANFKMNSERSFRVPTINGQSVSAECSATLRKENSKWIPVLGKGRFLPNS